MISFLHYRRKGGSIGLGDSAMTRVRLSIQGMAAGGDGVARKGSLVYFVQGAITGDEVEAQITDTRPSFARARVRKILTPSPHRIAPQCPEHEQCGGCPWAVASYPFQLEAKRIMVIDALDRLGGLSGAGDLVSEVIPSPSPIGYRNRIRLHVDRGRAGFHAPGSNRLVPATSCSLAHSSLNRVLSLLSDVDLSGMTSVELRTDSSSVQVILNGDGSLSTGATDRIHSLQSVSGVISSPATVLGSPYLYHTIRGTRFRVGYSSFFQVNTLQAERMYGVVEEMLEPSPGDSLLDVYSGVGAAGLSLSRPIASLIGVEQSRDAVEDARHNARIAGMEKARFVAGRAERVMARARNKPTLTIVNPPRTGCHPAVLSGLTELGPERVVYVSCNPATLARDVKRWSGAYRPLRVTPLDMFPQTGHVEAVVLMEKE